MLESWENTNDTEKEVYFVINIFNTDKYSFKNKNLLWNVRVGTVQKEMNVCHQQSNYQILQECSHPLLPYFHDRLVLATPIDKD